jgi:HAD superfamily hydrolase (TIGR01549 family)
VRAVLFDVDGTLYRQDTLRLLMGLELAALPVIKGSYRSATNVWKTLSVFRRVREDLRRYGAPTQPLEKRQFTATAARLGVEPTAVESVVTEWMFQRPIKYLRFCRRHGVEQFFALLKDRNVPIGMFSDYPAREKLQALGLPGMTNLTLCATDPDINAFKPHPAGYLRACAAWGLAPDEVLYIGDRLEIDAAGAASAGMPCAIVSKGPKSRFANCYDAFLLSSFAELHHAFVNHFKH